MTIVDTIADLFVRFGDHGYGEAINQREHALQVAHFARADGASDTLIAAAVLHDIGQFFEEAGDAADREDRDAHHEDTGATFLAPYFPDAVVAPIRLHVAAKRYLCAVDPRYQATLSSASLLSLRLQGGPFDAAEAAAFWRRDHADDAVRLRRYDDLGKQRDLRVEPFDFYRPLLTALLR